MRRAVAAALAGVILVAGSTVPASATSSKVTAADSSESWYTTLPASACSSPIGCPPVSAPSPQAYPANTLHVAATFGQATASAYVEPDMANVATGDVIVSGSMTLPLATVTGNGNVDTSTATIEACLVTAPFTDGDQGSTASPPPSDCSVHEPVMPGSKAFTLNLMPFLDAWRSGKPEFGIALLPHPATAANWHVAFNGRQLHGVPHIISTIDLAAGAAPSAPVAPVPGALRMSTTAAPPRVPVTSPAAPATGNASPAVAPAPTATPAAPAPALAATPTAQPVTSGRVAAGPLAIARSTGFRYPEVMLLPLVFAAGLLFAVRLLTSDATPRRKPARTAP